MKKLVLIDSNAIIHRAYHSMPKNMSTSHGELTGVVYGFATTLIKVLEDLNPDYVAASFDLSGPTFRHKEYKEYKATRVKADQELYDQIPRVRELVSTMEIPIYEKEGFEADDVIGTITKQISNDKLQNPNKKLDSKFKNKETPSTKLKTYNLKLKTYIVSGDKDIFQLVNGNVKVYNLKKGLSQTQIVDREVIQKDYGLDPEDFIDLKALAGDASDNIPGIPGIGPKTATVLLQKFDTLDGIYENLDRCEEEGIKPRIVGLLKDYKEQAYMSQKLATIHKEVPIDFSLEESKFGEYDKEKLRQFFEELGFRSLLKRFGASGETNNPKNQSVSKDLSHDKEKDKQLRLL